MKKLNINQILSSSTIDPKFKELLLRKKIKKIEQKDNIRSTKGNIFDSQCQTIINTVNQVGVMGAGLAKQFKQRYPDMFEDYKEKCYKGELTYDRPHLYKTMGQNGKDRFILNLATKNHWKNSSSIEGIKKGLDWIKNNYKEEGITSIAIPPLGCGLGGLNWNEVKPLIKSYLKNTDLKIEIYEPINIKAKKKNIDYTL